MFLGFRVKNNRIKPAEKTLQGIINYSMPKNKWEIQRFLELINYNSNFFEKISETLKPLYELTENDTKYEWTKEINNAFNDIKKMDRWAGIKNT